MRNVFLFSPDDPAIRVVTVSFRPDPRYAYQTYDVHAVPADGALNVLRGWVGKDSIYQAAQDLRYQIAVLRAVRDEDGCYAGHDIDVLLESCSEFLDYTYPQEESAE